MTTDHGKCPHCHADLNGDFIWQTFIDQGETEGTADEWAHHYGATRTEGRWGRAIGLYDRDLDRTVRWKCPDCDGEWPR